MVDVPSPIFDWTDKPKQKAFFMDRKSPTIGGGGGYNSGKSYAMIGKIHMALETFAGSRAIIGRKTYSALEKSVVPTYQDIVWRRNGGSWNGPTVKKFTDLTAHYTNGSTLWFTTFDEVTKVRGPNIAYAGISQAEEVAYEFFTELKGRCRQWNPETIKEFVAKHGERLKAQFGFVPIPFNQLICEFNPAPNWVRKEFIFNEAGANKFYDIPSIENKKYHAEGWIEDLRRSYSVENFNRFINGSWDVFGGMVYPEFDIEELHGIPTLVIPPHWPRIIGWDHGYRNPTAIEVGAVDEMGNLVWYKEHYRDNMTVKQNAECFKVLARGDKFPIGSSDKLLVFMDYGVKGQYDQDGKTIWDEYSENGIYGLNPDKDVNAGINMVKQYLKADPGRRYPPWHPRAGQFGSPKMFWVRGACPNFVNEMQTYQWEEKAEGRELNYQEKPKKFNDHAVDAGRYACMALGKQMAEWISPPPTLDEFGAERQRHLTKHAFTRAVEQFPYDETEGA